MSKAKKVIVTTPVGKMNWAKLVKPDEKFLKYSVELVMEDSEQLQKLINQIDEMIDNEIKVEQAKIKAEGKPFKKFEKKSNPISEVLDNDGNPTGSYKMKPNKDSIFRKTNEVISGPPLVSPAGRVLTETERNQLRINNGSTGRLSILLSPYVFQGSQVGVSLKLQGAQIIELASREASMNNESVSGFTSMGEDFDFVDVSDTEEFKANSDSDSDF